jgi:NAD(P)-dependent dehydrogenase (short-subunit alcohol dehydrogenase family)
MTPANAPTTAVLVTGAGSGIGRATALALIEVGRPVVIWDLDDARARAVGDECAAAGGKVHVEAIDVSADAGYAAAIARAVDAVGPIGGLVHSAGLGLITPIDALTADDWDRVLDVNLRAYGLLMTALVPTMRDAMPGSAIVGISSVEGLVGNQYFAAYCASKAGMLGLTRSAAHRLGGEGIRVNALCPGAIITPMTAPVTTNEAMLKITEGHTALGRMGEAAEVATTVRFLLSDEASYITGATIVVDGGWTAFS